MKLKRVFLTLFLSATGMMVWAQCDLYHDYSQLKSYEMTSYDTKDKMTGKSVMNIKDYQGRSDGFFTTIQTVSYDKKNKEVGDHVFSMECKDGTILIDMKDWVPSSSMESIKNMEMEITGDNIQIPQNLKVGKILPDANMTAKAKEQTMGSMNVNYSVTNRIVEAKEQITTPMGSFDTFKVSYLIKIESEVMGIKVPFTIKGIDYFAEGWGVVKSESFNKSGKLIGYTLLTDVKK
jgi:hypothetical protein